jgi:hypothetical protein
LIGEGWVSEGLGRGAGERQRGRRKSGREGRRRRGRLERQFREEGSSEAGRGPERATEALKARWRRRGMKTKRRSDLHYRCILLLRRRSSISAPDHRIVSWLDYTVYAES